METEQPKDPAQTKFGSKNGNLPKMPSFEKDPGKFSAGSARSPPITGPRIVPIDHTNGMTA
jgi:hypothetical protein